MLYSTLVSMYGLVPTNNRRRIYLQMAGYLHLFRTFLSCLWTGLRNAARPRHSNSEQCSSRVERSCGARSHLQVCRISLLKGVMAGCVLHVVAVGIAVAQPVPSQFLLANLTTSLVLRRIPVILPFHSKIPGVKTCGLRLYRRP
jgi:hypothetical protein